MEEVADTNARFAKAHMFLNSAENFYLRALRSTTLIIATLMIAYAGWLGLSGIYKASRDVKSVQEAKTVVSAQDILAKQEEDALQEQSAGPAAQADPLAKEKAYYRAYVAKYRQLYKAKYEPYRQASDPILNSAQFDERFLSTNGRLNMISKGELDFEKDKAVLEKLYGVMTELAESEKTIAKLKKYRVAKKVQVKKTVSGTRPVQSCGYYSYYSGCLYYQTNYVTYKEVVTKMAFPKGTVSHVELFSSYQADFLKLFGERKTENAANAAKERNEILSDNAEGKANIWTAFQIAGAFLMLMFFFLLIAIERHQRKMSGA